MEILSNKDKVFVKELVETGNKTQAAKKAYNYKNNNVAGVQALDKLKKPSIINAIKSIAEQIPDELLVEKLTALLNKEEVVTKNNMTTGNIDILPTGEIDVQAVSKGLDMTFKLKGSYAPDKNINININQEITPETLEKAKSFDEWYKKQQTSKT